MSRHSRSVLPAVLTLLAVSCIQGHGKYTIEGDWGAGFSSDTTTSVLPTGDGSSPNDVLSISDFLLGDGGSARDLGGRHDSAKIKADTAPAVPASPCGIVSPQLGNYTVTTTTACNFSVPDCNGTPVTLYQYFKKNPGYKGVFIAKTAVD